MTELKIIQTTPEELKSIVAQSVTEAIAQAKPPAPQKRTNPYTKKELRSLLKVAMPTIDRWSKLGILERIEIGSRVYFSVESVNELLESKK